LGVFLQALHTHTHWSFKNIQRLKIAKDSKREREGWMGSFFLLSLYSLSVTGCTIFFFSLLFPSFLPFFFLKVKKGQQ
jgi:hypothetical protein